MSVSPSGDVYANQNVTVSVNVTDNPGGSGVKNVTLSYTVNNATWNDVSMSLNATSGLWAGIIPGQINGTLVQYKIRAFDNAGNLAINSNAGAYFSYLVIPEFTPIMLIMLLTIQTAVVIAVRKRFIRSP